MRKSVVLLSVCCVGLALAGIASGGCSSSRNPPGRDGGQPDAGGTDAGPSPDGGGSGADGGMPAAVPTTITLENAGSAPLMVGNLCGGSFVSLEHDGERLQIDRSCACACDDPGACGCPPFCAITQQLVVPGTSAALEWDGLYAHFDDGASCYELAGLQSGDVVTAEACWNEDADNTPLACASVDFAYDVEREVVIRADHHSAARTPVRIVLENQSADPIRIVTESCGVQDWFRLAIPGEERAVLSVFCPCSCDDEFGMEPGGCPACGPCADPVEETLQPGATHAFEWDGRFWYAYPSGCSRQYSMPAGLLLNAEVCFTRAGESERTCQPLSFVLGESAEVRATVP